MSKLQRIHIFCLLFISNRITNRMGPSNYAKKFYIYWFANMQDIIDKSIIMLHGKDVQVSALEKKEALLPQGLFLQQFPYPCFINAWYVGLYVEMMHAVWFSDCSFYMAGRLLCSYFSSITCSTLIYIYASMIWMLFNYNSFTFCLQSTQGK